MSCQGPGNLGQRSREARNAAGGRHLNENRVEALGDALISQLPEEGRGDLARPGLCGH